MKVIVGQKLDGPLYIDNHKRSLSCRDCELQSKCRFSIGNHSFQGYFLHSFCIFNKQFRVSWRLYRNLLGRARKYHRFVAGIRCVCLQRPKELRHTHHEQDIPY